MKRRTVIVMSVGIALLLGCVPLLLRHYRVVELSSSAITPKPITPPESWSDDCSKILSAARDSEHRSVESKSPLDADEIAIYKAVLDSWRSKSRTLLNVSDRTMPLDAMSHQGISDCECLKGIDTRSLLSASHSFHRLTQELLAVNGVKLVDHRKQIRIVQSNDPGNRISKGKPLRKAVDDAIASGLFSISEIAFNKQHQRALVMYSFICGSLCGSGGTWLFERVDGVWKKAAHPCGGWVS